MGFCHTYKNSKFLGSKDVHLGVRNLKSGEKIQPRGSGSSLLPEVKAKCAGKTRAGKESGKGMVEESPNYLSPHSEVHSREHKGQRVP